MMYADDMGVASVRQFMAPEDFPANENFGRSDQSRNSNLTITFIIIPIATATKRLRDNSSASPNE